MRKKLLKKCSIALTMMTLLVPTTLANAQSSNPVGLVSTQSSNSEPIEFQRAVVHDPSIIKDPNSGKYYVFGSHIAAAESTDLINWTNISKDYETPKNSLLFGDLSENLAESFDWAGENDSDSKNGAGFAVWAPDVFWNGDYDNEDGTKGAYMMYYSVSSTYIRSAIGMAVSKDIKGPYKYVDTIIYSGFTNIEDYDKDSQINKHYENTNIDELIADKTITAVDPEWFTESGQYNNALYTNAIDPNVLYDKEGKLWMTYGSWSGGTFVLELDKETGKPIYPGEDGETDGRMIDRYFGTKIAGGYGRSGEATYAVYDKESDFYYLYVTYGGLGADGGYQMRQFRSRDITGPYVDAEENEAVFPESFNKGVGNFPSDDDHKDIGNKMIGNFLFKRDLGEEGTGIGTGYKSPGHNSYLIDPDTGKQFIVTHTRFPGTGEMHEVRVHQTFKNIEKWPVPTPYHYAGETIGAVAAGNVIGNYKYINHGQEVTGNLTESKWMKLDEDGKITGAVTGSWKLYDNYRAELTISGETYDGVFIRQYDPTSQKWVMTFSAMSNDGVVIWGSYAESRPDAEVVSGIVEELSTTIPTSAIKNISLPTSATQGAQITWSSSDTAVISNEGKVARPSFGSEDADIKLTATVKLGEITETKELTVKVPAEEQGGLAAFYDFSKEFSDRSGKQVDATVTGNLLNNTGGTITFEDGVVGKAAKFNGESGLKLADGLIKTNQYSISLWMKPEEITQFTTSFFGAKTAKNWISLVPYGHTATKVWSNYNDGGNWYDADSDSVIPAGEWTHFVFTVNEGEAKVYINGEAKFTGTNFPDIFTTEDAEFGLGVNYFPLDKPFKGLMDEVRVYDGIVLPEQEVQSLYKNPDGLTANYNFEDNLNDQEENYSAGEITGNLVDNTGGEITYVDGITGKAAVFNGHSGVRLPKGVISSNSYSVSVWLSPKELTQHTTTFFGARTKDNWVSLVPYGPDGSVGKTIVWSGGDPSWYDAATDIRIPTNKWSHLAFTVENGNVVVYLNGEVKFTGGNFPNVFTTKDGVFALGVNYWNPPYKGLMDDLRIYGNTVLSAEEVKDYYTSLAENGAEQPGTQQPGTETPGTQQPGTETPGTQQPGTETPGTQQPGTETPGTQQPGTETPGTQQPGTEKPEAEKPTKPETEKPETEKPTKPGTEKPEAEKPTKPDVNNGGGNNSGKPVLWKGAELKKGQIGLITLTKDINLWKREGNKLVFVRVLKAGESYRVYNYDGKYGGQYGVGAGLFITNMESYVKYETPSKAKLAEVNKK